MNGLALRATIDSLAMVSRWNTFVDHRDSAFYLPNSCGKYFTPSWLDELGGNSGVRYRTVSLFLFPIMQ